ncbi:MAG: hypothetical protein AB9917_14780 [Negativicutes bacterium]
MKNYNRIFISCLLMICGIGVFAVSAEAANLEWMTTELYYERNDKGQVTDNLIIQGYFSNKTDQYVNWFYEVNLTAVFTSKASREYSRKIPITVRNFEKMIDPHGTVRHRFHIRNVEIVHPIETYEVIPGYMRWKQSRAAG